jgi:type II secretory pathway component PulK
MGSCYPVKANALLAEFFMKKASPRFHSSRGAALLLSLWALFLLSAMVIAWALNINSRLTVSAYANRALSAEAMASSGAEVSLARETTPRSANLHRKIGNGDGYDVQMTGECGRLNLNFLTQGEDPNKLQILRQYLSLKGVDLNEQDLMMDSLLDWVSANRGLQHLNACPETDDYHPPHQPLGSVDELKKVCGWADLTSKPGWDRDFTVTQACGTIDVAYASRDVLRAVLAAFGGSGDDRVDAFLQLRQGPDGIDGTADDGVIDSSTVLPMLGIQPPQTQAARNQGSIQNLIQYKTSNVFRVVSVGKSGDVTRSVQMIVQKQMPVQPVGTGAQAVPALAGGRPTIYSWKEL